MTRKLVIFKCMKDLVSIPDYIMKYSEIPAMQRLKNIDMNCGVEKTSLPLFKNIQPYSRFIHSLRVACIIHHFTRDKKQTLAGLFHDISTPVFSHTIDFMNHDHMHQESTEKNTKEILCKDSVLMNLLQEDHISIEEIYDYHMYSIADNDTPKLSSDRLEYTIGNSINYGFSTEEEMKELFDDIVVATNESGEEELCFQNEEKAYRFTSIALQCGKVYSSSQDRYAMEILAHLIKDCMASNIISYEDLYKDERTVISKIKHLQAWKQYCSLCNVIESKDGIIIHTKKRYIDPFVVSKGRILENHDKMRNDVNAFLNASQDQKLTGEFENGR